MATDTSVMEVHASMGNLDALEFDSADLRGFDEIDWQEISEIRGIVDQYEEVSERSAENNQPLPPTSPAAVSATDQNQTTESTPEKFTQKIEAMVSDLNQQAEKIEGGIDRVKRMDEFWKRLKESQEECHAMRETVAEQAVEAHRLKERAKSAKDILKESTEELSRMERQLETLEEQWEDGSWANIEVHSIGDQEADGGDDSDSSSNSNSDESPAMASTATDPATTAKITCLNLTPGRLETLEQAECRTVADLERLMREGGLQKLKGFGPKAVEVVTDKLREWRTVNPLPESLVPIVPLVDGQFDQTQYLSGKTACVDGIARTGNPNQHLVGGFGWKSWDAGWVEKCRELGKPMELIEQQDMSPAATSTVTPAGIAANVPDVIPVDELEPYTDTAAAEPTDHEPTLPDPVEPVPVSVATPAADPLADWPEDDLTPELIGAYRAGSEAGLEGKKVTANPHKRGSSLWHKWDAGWQRSYVPSEDDLA